MKSKKIYRVISIWIIIAVILLMVLVQVQSYANLINNAGLVRGGTQRIVKLEISGAPNEHLIERVDSLLSKIEADEKAKRRPCKHTKELQENLLHVRHLWEEMKNEIQIVRNGGDSTKLFELSEEHFEWSDKAVFSAQIRAELQFKYIVASGILVVILTSSLMVFLEMRNSKKLRDAFSTDMLTGLPNEKAFEERVEELVSATTPKAYSLVYININNFKFINESYGYPTGDRILIALAHTLREFCNKGETCGRITADRFAILLYNNEDFIQRLQQAVNQVLLEDEELNLSDIITCSYGVYQLENEKEPAKAISSKASRALYEGKSKDGVAFYDSYLTDKIKREHQLTQLMAKAIQADEFEVYLQPKIKLGENKVVGSECLCRWISKEFGFLPPDEFIPLFEKNGFIVTLDFHMLEKMCIAFKEKVVDEKQEAINFAINFSKVSLLQDNFVERICEIVEKYQVPTAFIEIEVTESAFVVNEDAVIEMLEELRGKGYTVAMDDFGNGYSSLNLLRKLPIDTLKIDRDFLREGTTVQRTNTIIKSIIEMGNSLDIDMVCEGIETEEQVKLLTDMGCDVGQGYYFSKPIPLEEFYSKYVYE